MFIFALHLDSRLAPKGKDQAWIHADVIEGKMYCKCCKTWIIGEIRLELQQQFDEFEEEKAKQKEMYDH